MDEIDEVRKWKLNSIGYQQTFYERFGDRRWDSIDREDTNTLNTKIAYTLFGKPFGKCSDEEIKTVEDTRNKVLELNGSGNVDFGCPGRIYRGFKDFLQNNKLPKCDMCFPTNGVYTARDGWVRIQFQKSPSCSITFKVLDIVSFVGKAASLGLMAVSVFFPVVGSVLVAGGVVLGTTTTYSTSRNIVQLVDRNKHHQSLSLINKDARMIWLDMSNDIIGAILAGGAAALPRLVSSGRFTAKAISTVCEVLSWASLGVNSFGVIANIAHLVFKFRNGTLDKSDVEYFISSCLFIGNLIVSAVIANEIIRELSERPSHLHKLFKMSANTSFKTVKFTIACFTPDAALEILCGNQTQTFFTFFDLPYTGSVVRAAGNILKQFQLENSNPAQLCFELYKLLTTHLQQAQTEVDEAMHKLDKFCKFLSNQRLTVNGRQLFNNSRFLAPEVVHSVEDVVEKLNITDQVIQENSAGTVMKLAVELSRETGVKNERQFVDVCKILMNDIISRCDRRLILNEMERKTVSTNDKQRILDEVIRELKKDFAESGSRSTSVENAMLQPEELHLRPLYQVENFHVFAFEASSKFGEFDQFLNDTTCKLLQVDKLPSDAYFYWDSEHTMVVRANNKSVVFFYNRQDHAATVFGIALVATEQQELA
ncbi:hypothetical protein ACFE04_008358 [Oxalis oulophora]